MCVLCACHCGSVGGWMCSIWARLHASPWVNVQDDFMPHVHSLCIKTAFENTKIVYLHLNRRTQQCHRWGIWTLLAEMNTFGSFLRKSYASEMRNKSINNVLKNVLQRSKCTHKLVIKWKFCFIKSWNYKSNSRVRLQSSCFCFSLSLQTPFSVFKTKP